MHEKGFETFYFRRINQHQSCNIVAENIKRKFKHFTILSFAHAHQVFKPAEGFGLNI